MRLHTATGRPLLPWIIIAVVVVLAAVVASVAYGAGSSKRPSAAPTSSAPTASAEPTSDATSGAGDGDSDAAPTGCIAGDDRTPAMVLAAQKKAGHTAYGAVEAAAAFYRWSLQYPYPTKGDVRAVAPFFTASARADAMKGLTAEYASDDQASEYVPKGTPFYLSTAAGYWIVAPDSTTDKITVSINANYVIDGELSPTKAAAETFVMVWEGGAWHLDALQPAEIDKLNAGGTRFTAGC